ncbi:hypothetical protein O181_023441 [Austropuccinia psidii MF-1]|uniref:Reverse transcriptase Ty1/copia-type domain-containing protein n=1 Tax=Austropuccinia psidii MF-1 TaxID=1389203 RepID=A0A9Q3CJD9_9BASI|nr:hypothetical protein [Austropuccinia psidii MF-1]
MSLKTMGLPEKLTQCATCDFNNTHALPFNHQFDPVSQPLDCIHIDLAGPISPMSVSGFRDRKVVIEKHITFYEDVFLSLDYPTCGPEPLLIPLLVLKEEVAVDEVGTVESAKADNIVSNQLLEALHSPDHSSAVKNNAQPEDKESLADEPPIPPPRRIKVIGPQHPTLISCDLDCSNVLPYSRQPNIFVSSCDNTPRMYQGAIKSSNNEKWMESISKELGSVNQLDVWDVVDLDPKFKLVGTRWVFKVKKDHLGNITEHKAQLCAQGFTQIRRH